MNVDAQSFSQATKDLKNMPSADAYSFSLNDI